MEERDKSPLLFFKSPATAAFGTSSSCLPRAFTSRRYVAERPSTLFLVALSLNSTRMKAITTASALALYVSRKCNGFLVS